MPTAIAVQLLSGSSFPPEPSPFQRDSPTISFSSSDCNYMSILEAEKNDGWTQIPVHWLGIIYHARAHGDSPKCVFPPNRSPCHATLHSFESKHGNNQEEGEPSHTLGSNSLEPAPFRSSTLPPPPIINQPKPTQAGLACKVPHHRVVLKEVVPVR